jgi:hypothetical protein
VTVNFSLDWRDVCSHTQRSVRGQSETYIVEAWIFRRLDIIHSPVAGQVSREIDFPIERLATTCKYCYTLYQTFSPTPIILANIDRKDAVRAQRAYALAAS